MVYSRKCTDVVDSKLFYCSALDVDVAFSLDLNRIFKTIPIYINRY